MSNKIVLNIRFKIKPGQKEAFRYNLFELIEQFKEVPEFIHAIVSDDIDHPHDLHIYEVWEGTRESWIEHELPKPYRKDYEETLGSMIEDRIVSWHRPIGEWGGNVTGKKF
ncbi:antibiotic biosynthesis monooxygenase family protein [Rossellomorea vietnamensis]|uniref:putative quinol monooxygenase n=1 Tax=Rossellomorea vietnamensis TaxID=218284 RepID=UPI003D2C0E8F